MVTESAPYTAACAMSCQRKAGKGRSPNTWWTTFSLLSRSDVTRATLALSVAGDIGQLTYPKVARRPPCRETTACRVVRVHRPLECHPDWLRQVPPQPLPPSPHQWS